LIKKIPRAFQVLIMEASAMEVFFWIVDLQIPFMMIVIGLIFRKWAPKKINSVTGYRTKRSMASQEAWEYANRRFAELWLKIGCLLLALIILIKLLFPFNSAKLSLIINLCVVAIMLLSTLIVERELKEKFNY